MTTASADKPDEASVVDPGAIDLEAIKTSLCRPYDKPWRDSLPIEDVNALIAAVEALRMRVETARLEVEQCHAKATCCCGDYMKQHTGYDGHSPVALYDYALDGAETRAEAAEARGVELAGALEWFDNHARALATDLKSAHHARVDAASEWMREDDKELRVGLSKATECARTVLAATPAEALERGKGFEQLARDAISDLRRYARDDGPERRMVSVRVYEKAIAKLDALDKE